MNTISVITTGETKANLIKIWARQCDFCGKGMNEGFVINDCEHACSDECLLFTEPHQDRYWTEWEDKSEYEYEELNGRVEDIGFWTQDPNFVGAEVVY
ncbi:MAG TPA: hypothetical protein PKY82_35830 [Pyrinomonadaceae bacterium]|nr:hypothetical protein [Pyrinomonadaceae bacterium]